MASYTYGMNDSLPMARAPIVMLWRSDYVYPRGLYEKYLRFIADHDIVLPTPSTSARSRARELRPGKTGRNWRTTTPILARQFRRTYSIYESQDPVHFAVRAKTWARTRRPQPPPLGLRLAVWLNSPRASAVICRAVASNTSITTGPSTRTTPRPHGPLGGFDAKKSEEDRVGRQRFAEFLAARKCSPATSIAGIKSFPPSRPMNASERTPCATLAVPANSRATAKNQACRHVLPGRMPLTNVSTA